MDKMTMAKLSWKHAKNLVMEEIYIATGIDHTKPVSFYAEYNERCNVKCRYCGHWRADEYHEMSPEEWRKGLLSVREFVGSFSISFSGGEPFIKPGLIELLGWCHEQGISAGVTTNGSALNSKIAAKVVAARPFNVNISVDAPTAELHDYLRGSPGLFDRLTAGIRFLRNEQEKQGVRFPIIIKPTITVKNFHVLPEMVEWAKASGATAVSPQPLERWTPETFNELWIEEQDLPEFEMVIERLVKMVEDGEPILTPVAVLRLMADHFREKPAPRSQLPCRVGTRNFFIRATGDVMPCNRGFPAIGNIRNQSAREIWTGELGRQIRGETYACERLCLMTCVSQKTLGDKFKMGVKLLGARSSRGMAVSQAG